MPVCALHLTEPSQSYFWRTCLVVQECARWSLGYFLHASERCMLPRSTSLTHRVFLLIVLSSFLSPPVSTHRETHTLTCRKEATHTFSLNTLNLNSLLIRRYVTSLTLPSSPSSSPPILCTHPCLAHSSLSPTTLHVSFFPHLYLLMALRSLYLLFFFPLGACPFRGTCEHSTAPLKTVSNLKVN